MLGFLAAGVAVIVWLRRARLNAEVFSAAPHRLAAGWAVGSWFVPLASVWLPFVVVSDVERAGPGGGRGSAASIVWWVSWIGAGYLVPWAYAATIFGGADPRQRVQLIAVLLVAELVAAVVAAACFTLVATRVARWQDERIRELRG